mmetsp:Transcript_16549/g.39964  ORF Transcript_16549/g.39964 Transcript_16549/m.39964 type:complete len:204 (-) Transcript_16549:117-728(-)
MSSSPAEVPVLRPTLRNLASSRSKSGTDDRCRFTTACRNGSSFTNSSTISCRFPSSSGSTSGCVTHWVSRRLPTAVRHRFRNPSTLVGTRTPSPGRGRSWRALKEALSRRMKASTRWIFSRQALKLPWSARRRVRSMRAARQGMATCMLTSCRWFFTPSSNNLSKSCSTASVLNSTLFTSSWPTSQPSRSSFTRLLTAGTTKW